MEVLLEGNICCYQLFGPLEDSFFWIIPHEAVEIWTEGILGLERVGRET